MEASYVTESKARCLAAGMDPASIPVPVTVLSEAELMQRKIKYSEVISVVSFLEPVYWTY
ncbi:hypothetical protein N6H14_02675 [Paenibacillus sp. CC-CFT747]|nr:hypothetical protein N6H14_02675 [Paenibacillus sp. CC-CFT747]